MEVMLILILVSIICVIGLLIFAFLKTKNFNNKNSKNIIDHFEPKNAAPELTEMINYHKQNETIHYEL